MTVHCKCCNHQWDIELKMPIPLSQFTRMLRGYALAGCSECGAHGNDVLLGAAPERRANDVDEAAAVRSEP